MWSRLAFCLLVGLTCASNNPAWKDNSEYVYRVRGRTLASIHEVSNQYCGIWISALLRIQTRPNGVLLAQLSEPEYCQIHSQLHDGWNTHIPDAELSWKHLAMSLKPFQIEMRNGVITDLIVSKDVSNWEANIMKGIVSQFQLNTSGNRHLTSQMTSLPESQQNAAVFKTMEDTVSGNTETLYEISPLPDYIFQSPPMNWRYLQLKGSEEVIEVVKHKNYTNYVELPSYSYGFGGIGKWTPATNQMGDFFVRDSISRAVLTGNLNRYTIQNSYTVSKAIVNPTLTDKEKGSVISMINVTLEAVKSQDQKIEAVSDPVRLGNLVYTYETPFSTSNEVREKKPYQGKQDYEMYSERYQRENKMKKPRSVEQDSYEDSSVSSETNYQQDQPQINQPPASPLLPYTMGYKGLSIKQNINIVKSVQKLAQEIGNDLENPTKPEYEPTLNRFTILSSLIRLMTAEELQRAASELYSQSDVGLKYAAWVAYRDAVAECGTGPAFLAIQSWILTRKIKDDEASQIVSTMTNAVRQPTLEYMKSYFELIKKPQVLSQWPLNDTALLAYSSLIRRVIVDKFMSGKQYPVESFGSFRTKEGLEFVRKTVIPYFTNQLNVAISHAETHKIHAYIVALGNIADPEILSAYEPYLEGKKQASQYQRLLMVVSMTKLVETYPKEARSVLFKIYQNSGESQEVRIAAVHQLLRTVPPADMLQLMASYTNIDRHEHVNAAVKSAIETAAELDGEEYEYLRSAAQAAKPLLTKKNYGVQHGGIYLRSYFFEELQMKYKESVQYFGSEDQFYPKGIKYSLRSNLGGLQRRLTHVEAMITSIDELIHVGLKQTYDYQKKQQEQEQNAQQQQQYPWSSQNIARLLNMNSEEREQLEGYLYMEFGWPYKMLSFDNRTLESLPEVIQKYEEEFKSGKKINYIKLINNREMALSFPTAMGLPFLFTYDTPSLIKVQGNVKAVVYPQIFNEDRFLIVKTVKIESDLKFTLSSKVQSRLSFTTPFDHQQYVSGFDKHFEMNIPLNGNFKMDFDTMEFSAEIEPTEFSNNSPLVHYATWPYTSRIDIFNFRPLSLQPNSYIIIQPGNLRSLDHTLGQKDTGLAYRVQIDHERQFIDSSFIAQVFSQQSALNLMSLWDDAAIQFSRINITYVPSKSTTHKLVVRLGYQQKYVINPEQENADGWKQLPEVPDPVARQHGLLEKAAAGIKHASVYGLNASIEFQGDRNINYILGGALGKSNVDPKSRILFYYKKTSPDPEVKPYEVLFESKSFIPNTNALDLHYSWENDPKADSEIELSFGSTLESPSKIHAKVEFRRSEERKEYLKQQSMYQNCQSETRKNNNKQWPACVNMTMASNLLDRVNVTLQYKNLKPNVVDAVQTAYEVLRFNYLPSLETVRYPSSEQSNGITMQARFDPDLRSVNVSVKTQEKETTFQNIFVSEYGKEIFVLHPVFHLRCRLMAKALSLQTYRPNCVVDQTQVSTFNNRTYPADLSKYWTVMLQYVPKESRHQDKKKSVLEQLKSQPENYVVLVRENPQSEQKKDVKITLSAPETEFKVVDITMSPYLKKYTSAKVKVAVDGQEIKYSEEKVHDIKQGYIQIYALPNGEVKVEVRDAFYVIYDGHRVRVTVAHGQFRDAVRGICGQFNDEETEDFLTPEYCIARNPRKFIQSYEVEGRNGQQVRQEFAGQTLECVDRQVPLYVNVISDLDKHRQESNDQHIPGRCTHFQTSYIQQNGDTCFTIHALPACSSQCQPTGYVTKNVPVHCIPKSNAAELWKTQIDKGASPDFSYKTKTRTLSMEIPQGCSQ